MDLRPVPALHLLLHAHELVRRIAQEHRDILGAIERRAQPVAQAHVRNHLSKVKDAVLMGLAKGFDPSVELRNAREGYTIRPHGE